MLDLAGYLMFPYNMWQNCLQRPQQYHVLNSFLSDICSMLIYQMEGKKGEKGGAEERNDHHIEWH